MELRVVSIGKGLLHFGVGRWLRYDVCSMRKILVLLPHDRGHGADDV